MKLMTCVQSEHIQFWLPLCFFLVFQIRNTKKKHIQSENKTVLLWKGQHDAIMKKNN